MTLEKEYGQAMLGSHRPDYIVVPLRVIRNFAKRRKPSQNIQRFLNKSRQLPDETLCYLTRSQIGILRK